MKQRKKHLLLAMSIVTTMTLTACGTQSTSQNNLQHSNITPNIKTTFINTVSTPRVGSGTFVHPQSSVIGNVELKGKNYVAPFASIRGDEGQPIHIGSETNIQDGDNLPVIDKDYAFAHLNHEVVKVNKELAEGNLKK